MRTRQPKCRRTTSPITTTTSRPIRTLPERAASLSSLPSQSSLLSTGTQQLEAADVDLARSIDGLTVDGASSTPDVDVSILEALKSKDRLFVLKLGEQMEALIKERQCVFLSILSRLPYASCFERILLHTPHLSKSEARNGCISVFETTPLSDRVLILSHYYSSRTKYSLNTDTTYQRLLVHRCAGYYKLLPEPEPGSKLMSVVITMGK